MIKVHHLNNSRSQRILWLLEELGVEYEIVKYARDPVTMRAPDTLKAVHPLGKSPVVEDGAVLVAESGAIIEYLVEHYGDGRLLPDSAEAMRAYRYWLHFAEGSAMTPLLLKLYLGRLGEAGAPLLGLVEGQIAALRGYLEGALEGRPFFTGEVLTAADIQMSFPVEVLAVRGGVDAGFANLWGLLRRMQERPAYQRALKRGGTYELLK